MRNERVTAISNEVIWHEMTVQNISPHVLADSLGIKEETLMQLLRFELAETEQLRILWLVQELADFQKNSA